MDDEIAQAIAAAMGELDAAGSGLPLYLAVVAANGAFMIGAYHEADDGGLSVEVMAGGDRPYMLPLNIMLTDTSGKAARVLLTAEGTALQ
jgi:hypothetical protein